MGRQRAGVLLIVVAAILHGCGTRATHNPGDRAIHALPRISMTQTLANPGLITIFGTQLKDDFPWPETYTLGVTAQGRILQTTEFYQGGRERYQMVAMKPVTWGTVVPDGAELFGATSGISSGSSGQFWVGWIVGRQVQMQALTQEKPIDTELVAEENPIFPAVTDGAGLAGLYSWRSLGANKTALWRHLFSGQIKTKGKVLADALCEIPGRPLISVAGTIPGEASQHALIGWVENTEVGAVLGIAIITPDRARVLRSAPIPNFVPVARQRPGIWSSGPSFRDPRPFQPRFELSLALQSRGDPTLASYALARFSIGSEADHTATTLEPIAVPTGQLHSAAFDYFKDDVRPGTRRTYLLSDGRVFKGDDPPILFRQGVPLDSPLPVVTANYWYWAVRAPDGTVTFDFY